MLKVTYRLKLGQDEFDIQAEIKDEKEFIKTMSFYSGLPRTAPNGATDLKLVFRTTKKGHKYYSLVSESEKMEFKLGQNLEANGGGLFHKGWDVLYQGEDTEQDAGQSDQMVVGSRVVESQEEIQTPTIVSAPKTTAKAAVAKPAATVVQQSAVPTPAATVAAPQVAAAQKPPQNANVTATANNVLARFGINK